ncbi:general secretion pathway protein L [Alcanivorax sp. S71-1-4]|uniref:type II secretion system protein GspL n=1 Tax=Alcanivorax sp. S71-1-4 TaxID=1177159 RepID=UPI00135A381C|nr:type II secretion system protein GspL [Alcanivorax sp. S71-1-4]KAF0810471.1 general secretion pathway protein L [Alcanivorax sp. S71-1-4]
MKDDSTIIYLPAGTLRAESPDAVTAAWHVPGEGISRGTLSDALAALGGPVRAVLSSGDVLLTNVELSKRQARHMQKVLPFLLEESLLTTTDEMWYAYGKPVDGAYPVLACERDGLEQLLDWFASAGDITLLGAWVDADLLRGHAPCVARLDDDLLCIPAPGQALVLPATELEQVPVLLGIDTAEFTRIDHLEALFSAFADGLQGDVITLLHSDLRPTVEQHGWRQVMQPWWPVTRLAAGVLMCVWVLLLVQQWQYNRAAEAEAAQAVALYQELFPGSSRPQLLQREFRTQLERLSGGGAGAGFLALMAPVGEIIGGATDQGVTPRRVQFDERENTLLVDITAKDFSALENLREKMQSVGLSAEIGTARSEASGVTARMRVGQG